METPNLPTITDTMTFLAQLSAVVQPMPGSSEETGRRCRRRWVSGGASPRTSPYSRFSSGKTENDGAAAGKGEITTKQAAVLKLACIAPPQYWSAIGDCDHTDEGEALDASRPQFSFTCLIGLAVLASEYKRLSAVQIYEYVVRNFPYYKTAKGTWKNSVRHVLSLGKFFQKQRISVLVHGKKRGIGGGGGGGSSPERHVDKGGSWEIVPGMLALLTEHIAEGQQRLSKATARHLGLSELKREHSNGKFSSRIGKGRPHALPSPQVTLHQYCEPVAVVPLHPTVWQRQDWHQVDAEMTQGELKLDDFSMVPVQNATDSPPNFESDEELCGRQGVGGKPNFGTDMPVLTASFAARTMGYCASAEGPHSGAEYDVLAVDDWQDVEAVLESVFRELEASTLPDKNSTTCSSSMVCKTAMPTIVGFMGTVE
jgi:hypothetical protein